MQDYFLLECVKEETKTSFFFFFFLSLLVFLFLCWFGFLSCSPEVATVDLIGGKPT